MLRIDSNAFHALGFRARQLKSSSRLAIQVIISYAFLMHLDPRSVDADFLCCYISSACFAQEMD